MRGPHAKDRFRSPTASPEVVTTACLTADQQVDLEDEHVLVARLRTGDQKAFHEAILRFSPQMLATARSIVGPVYAEDIVQDSWLAVLEKISEFEGRAALATWLVRIVTNRAISHLRSRSKEVSTKQSSTDDDTASGWFDEAGRWAIPPTVWSAGAPEDLLSADELQDCIDKHLQIMPDQQRLVLVMRDIQLLSYADICHELGLSASNVRVLLHRGRIRLMNMVNGFEKSGTC